MIATICIFAIFATACSVCIFVGRQIAKKNFAYGLNRGKVIGSIRNKKTYQLASDTQLNIMQVSERNHPADLPSKDKLENFS
jgi:hypothetical protein